MLSSPAFHLDRRNQGIDALRGASIVLVILNHIGIRIPLKDTYLSTFFPGDLISFLNGRGYEAVFIFFVISGFLITQMSIKRWGKISDISLTGFYCRRLARIAPLLLALILLLSVFDLLRVPHYVIDGEGQSLVGAIFSTLGLYLNWYEGQTTWLPGGWDVLWSLSIEEMFYLLFPVAAIFTRRIWVQLPLFLLLAFSLPYVRETLSGSEIWQEKAYLPGMAAISAGIVSALIAEGFHPQRRRFPDLLFTFSLVVLSSLLLFENYVWQLMGQFFMLALTGVTACLLASLHWRRHFGVEHGYVGLGWLRAMGRWSYEIYLTHMFVVFAVVEAFELTSLDKQWGFLPYVFGLALCAALGCMVARYFSTPCDLALRRFFFNQRATYPGSGDASPSGDAP